MQTFLPYESFEASARCLDKKRCWKQVVEAKQIICTLRAKYLPKDWVESSSYKNQKWINHPAVAMWIGYEEALKQYYNVFLEHCLRVHKIDTKMPFIPIDYDNYKLPWWIGVEKFHRAMRSRLIEKDKNFYKLHFPKDQGYNEGKYFWPKNKNKSFKVI